MYKGSIELGKISKNMKIKFCLILESDPLPGKQIQPFSKLIDSFSYNGSEYLRISPKPFITIDISATKDKGDAWSSNTQVNLNKYGILDLMNKVKIVIDKFQDKDLFFLKTGKLQLNKDKAREYAQTINTPSSKKIGLIHVVVYDEENQEIEYEGASFMINSIDYHCELSYVELQFLYYVLSQINMDVLSMQLINTYLISKSSKGEIIHEGTRELTIDKGIVEEKNEEFTQAPVVKIENPNMIPDI